MPTTSLFVTRFYDEDVGDPALIEALEQSCRTIAADDAAGRRWSRSKGYRGYTSYASLDDLPRRDPNIASLVRLIDRHAAAFAADCAMDMGGRRPRLDSLWINLLKPGGIHSAHLHPHSIISGTLYVRVPPGAGSLKLEDPRLPMMMAAPPRRDDAPEAQQTFVYRQPAAGRLYLWESWLRHEVMPGRGSGDRISISFNYR